jgi:hypothetical protein
MQPCRGELSYIMKCTARSVSSALSALDSFLYCTTIFSTRDKQLAFFRRAQHRSRCNLMGRDVKKRNALPPKKPL